MKSKQILFASILVILGIITITSCVKQKFDNPPDSASYDPNLPVNSSILALKNLLGSSSITVISDDITISGIVTANDRSGAFYEQIVIQDSTTGIPILIEKSGLYGDYPVGRKVYIKCKGLYLGEYGKLIQIGYTPSGGKLQNIPTTLISDFIFKATTGNKVEPKIVNISQLDVNNKALVSTLIRIDSAQFIASEVNDTFHDTSINNSSPTSTNRNIEDCASNKIICRVSSYANYQLEKIPSGKGPITAIFTRFNSDKQLTIRETSDLNMTGVRCGGVVIQPDVNITIDSLRKMYPDTSSTQTIVLSNQIIHGTVISSYADSNISQALSFYMQDESGRGINVYGITGLELGDSITIKLSGHKLIVFNGSLEITKGAAGFLSATKVGSGKSVTPAIVTTAQMNTDLNNPIFNQRQYESRLVKLENVTISGSPITSYSGNKTVTDGAGSIILYSRNAIPFSTTALPIGTVNVTAIGIKYKSTPELYLRKLPNDIQ